VSRAAHHGLVALLALAAAATMAQGGETLPLLQPVGAWLLDHPLLAPLLFVLLYALAITLFFPGTLFCLLGGALFGPWQGALLNVLGATLGASLAFLIARHLAASMVERHLTTTLQRLKQGVETGGWRFVALLRQLPVVPYNLSNYAFGLCRIPLSQFAAATLLSLLPRLWVYAYLGHSGLALLSGESEALLTLLTMTTLLVALLLLPLLYARLRQPPGR
jgi:uncharacterized membrane protein YdjX (TVP38/TMEM64 family)